MAAVRAYVLAPTKLAARGFAARISRVRSTDFRAKGRLLAVCLLFFSSTECLARLDLKPVFVSAIGTDPLGVMMLKHCEEVNMVNNVILP